VGEASAVDRFYGSLRRYELFPNHLAKDSNGADAEHSDYDCSCSAKSATNQSAARPVVRMATAEASILSAFLNFPQFSVQSTAGRWRPGSRSPQVVLSTLEKNADSARDLSRPEPSRAYDRSRWAAGLPRRSRSPITAEPRPTGGVNAPPPGCYKLLQVRPCAGLLERVKRPTV